MYRNLDTATGNVTEDVKFYATHGKINDQFGHSVSLDGDRFIVGADYGDGNTANSGTAYTGTVSSLTTLDFGNASRIIDEISFISRTDWIIGATTNNNTVTLTSGDSGNVTASGKKVYIGQSSSSNNNTLNIAGNLTATAIEVGNGSNAGNRLIVNGIVDGNGVVDVLNGSLLGGNGSVYASGGNVNIHAGGTLSPGNSPGILSTGNLSVNGTLAFEIFGTTIGSQYDSVSVFGSVSLGTTSNLTLNLGSFTPTLGDMFFLIANDGTDAISGLLNSWAQNATFSLAGQWWQISYLGNSTASTFTGGNDLVLMAAIPEPATWALLTASLTALMAFRRRRRQG